MGKNKDFNHGVEIKWIHMKIQNVTPIIIVIMFNLELRFN